MKESTKKIKNQKMTESMKKFLWFLSKVCSLRLQQVTISLYLCVSEAPSLQDGPSVCAPQTSVHGMMCGCSLLGLGPHPGSAGWLALTSAAVCKGEAKCGACMEEPVGGLASVLAGSSTSCVGLASCT